MLNICYCEGILLDHGPPVVTRQVSALPLGPCRVLKELVMVKGEQELIIPRVVLGTGLD